MTGNSYIITKIFNILSSIILVLTGSYFLFISLKAMYDKTGMVNPEASLLFIPGIAILIISLFPILTLLLVKPKHSKGVNWCLTITGIVAAYLTISFFFL